MIKPLSKESKTSSFIFLKLNFFLPIFLKLLLKNVLFHVFNCTNIEVMYLILPIHFLRLFQYQYI